MVLFGWEGPRVVVGLLEVVDHAVGPAVPLLHVDGDVHGRMGADEVDDQMPGLVLRRAVE